MADTKEMILLTALRLFAKKGYEAVSVSMISAELGMVKSALYKHYKSKQDILDSILLRMQELDQAYAEAYEMPGEGPGEESSGRVTWEHLMDFTKAMFRHWTQDEFSALFRKMLTIEQYRDEAMTELYRQYLSDGPLTYVEEVLEELIGSEVCDKYKGGNEVKVQISNLALQFYAPMYMLYHLYDVLEDKKEAERLLNEHLEQFTNEVKNDDEKIWT